MFEKRRKFEKRRRKREERKIKIMKLNYNWPITT